MSLTPKLVLAIKRCSPFIKDQLFAEARAALLEAGTLTDWTNLVKNESKRTIDELVNEPTMDSVLFHQDRFEILIDTRGFSPEDVQCSITPTLVEVIAQKREKSNATTRSMSLTRSYQLPQTVQPEEGTCCMSSEGLLLITAPWLK